MLDILRATFALAVVGTHELDSGQSLHDSRTPRPIALVTRLVGCMHTGIRCVHLRLVSWYIHFVGLVISRNDDRSMVASPRAWEYVGYALGTFCWR